MNNFSVSQIDKTRRLKLSKWETLWHYLLGIIPIPLSVDSFYDAYLMSVKNLNSESSINDKLLLGFFLLLLGLAVLFAKWYRLKFRQFNISLTPKEFKDKIAQISKQKKWSIESNTDTYAQLTKCPPWTWGLKMTIIRKDNYILLNSICDPGESACISVFFENERSIAHFKKFLKTSNDHN